VIGGLAHCVGAESYASDSILLAPEKVRTSVGKYDALGSWLRRRRQPVVELSFADIERIIRALLPHCAADASWWTNERKFERGFVQCRAWLDAGFEAEPAVRGEKVVFRRVGARSNRLIDESTVSPHGC
jgi:hypothetical protein